MWCWEFSFVAGSENKDKWKVQLKREKSLRFCRILLLCTVLQCSSSSPYSQSILIVGWNEEMLGEEEECAVWTLPREVHCKWCFIVRNITCICLLDKCQETSRIYQGNFPLWYIRDTSWIICCLCEKVVSCGRLGIHLGWHIWSWAPSLWEAHPICTIRDVKAWLVLLKWNLKMFRKNKQLCCESCRVWRAMDKIYKDI